ncbi:MFS general substrate transporter [Fistulina hepatica ATCC 64428]|uniref:MFS general substrate transporter n=1 Tax=Fistulina hepatica ATCC 64428 TaxID=1128425 RepID=A0A0D7AJH1_9AGAR|nr:MFS general substrate transporter [Fistulina hepatica ATCC 64428]
MSTTDLEKKHGLGAITTVFACGAALYSDGYVNAAAGSAVFLIELNYPDYPSTFAQDFKSLLFAGTIVGMLSFGYVSDRIGRKIGMVFASLWLALWAFMSGIAWGGKHNTPGLYKALLAYRLLQGIAIGAEYPAGTVAAAENTEDPGVAKVHQQKLLILATNTMIDLGFVMAYFIPFVLLYVSICNHNVWTWRLTLGLGAVAPLFVLFFRLRMSEPARFRQSTMKRMNISDYPWWLIFKRYWPRVLAIAVVWWIYDWIAYPSGLYATTITDSALPADASLTRQIGWSCLINFFYMPGTLAGALVADRLGPKWTMALGLFIQSILGFGLAGSYPTTKKHIAGFAVYYGFYLAFGEFGPGNNLGLLASKVSGPTAVRGILYGFCAAIGKVGAFVGTYVYTPIQDKYGGPDSDLGEQVPVYIGSALALLAAVITIVLIPNPTPDGMRAEDESFRQYLEENGFDTSKMGLFELTDAERQSEDEKVAVSADIKVAQPAQ